MVGGRSGSHTLINLAVCPVCRLGSCFIRLNQISSVRETRPSSARRVSLKATMSMLYCDNSLATKPTLNDMGHIEFEMSPLIL